LRALGQSGVHPGRVSSLFETEPVGFRDQPWFLNRVVEVQTALPPEALLKCCLEIEIGHGRIRDVKNGPRTLDLDILLYGDVILSSPYLTIPHPRMTDRKFVLEPLAEIAPEVYHPLLKKSIRSLLAQCPDPSAVHLYAAQKDV